MALPAWSWPPSGATARGLSLVPYGSGIAVPDWTTPTVWPFSTASGAFLPGIVLASGTPGLAAAAIDAAAGLWTVAWDGRFWHQPFSGAVSASGVLPSGQVYVATATLGTSAFFLSATGAVLTTGGTQLGTWPTPAWFLSSSGTTLATILAASGIGSMSSGGVTGLIALPSAITTPTCLALASGQPLGLAGWANAPTLSGAAAAALDPQDPLSLLAVGSGFARFWHSPLVSGEVWTQGSTLAGLANLQSLAWRPDGTQILTTSLDSGQVQVLNYTAGILSVAQTVTLTGACSVAVAGDSVHALVAQSGQAQAATFIFSGGTWVSGAAVTGVPGITAVTAFGASGAVIAWASGVSFLNLTTGSTWAVGSSAALGFASTVLTVDAFSNIYTAGSGSLAVFAGPTPTGSGSWAGAAPTGIAVQEGRVALAVPTDGKLYIYGNTAPGAWTQGSSGTLALGSPVGLSLSATVLFAMGSGATQMYGFSGTPYVLTPVLSGAAAQWNGSSWTQTALGIGHIPTCCTFDASGDLLVATTFNALWTVTSGGVGTSGLVPTFSGQTQNVPLGTAAMLATSGHLYAATSLAGVLIEIS